MSTQHAAARPHQQATARVQEGGGTPPGDPVNADFTPNVKQGFLENCFELLFVKKVT